MYSYGKKTTLILELFLLLMCELTVIIYIVFRKEKMKQWWEEGFNHAAAKNP